MSSGVQAFAVGRRRHREVLASTDGLQVALAAVVQDPQDVGGSRPRGHGYHGRNLLLVSAGPGRLPPTTSEVA